MARINLLPWREELRKQQKQDFIAAICAAVALSCVLFGLVYMHIEDMKSYQQTRNQMLNNQIQVVNRKIKEIRDIEAKKNKLLTKINVIQTLQESRPQIVHLFDELAKSTPEGVYLSKFKQTGKALSLNGHAQSNARVSAFMRGIDASPWLESPVLQVIQGKSRQKNEQLSDFAMSAQQGENKAKDLEAKK